MNCSDQTDGRCAWGVIKGTDRSLRASGFIMICQIAEHKRFSDNIRLDGSDAVIFSWKYLFDVRGKHRRIHGIKNKLFFFLLDDVFDMLARYTTA